MAESVCRTLRDGVMEGEYAPVILLLDSITTAGGSTVFQYLAASLATNISTGKAQAKGLVFVALDQHPQHYQALLQQRSINRTNGWLHMIDCFSDPLGWERTVQGKELKQINEKVEEEDYKLASNLKIFRDIKNMGLLMSSILESGQSVGNNEKDRFSVIIDSVSTLLHHNSMQSVASFMTNFRSHGKLSSLCCMMHSDLHESHTVHAIEYLSSTTVFVEPVSVTRDTVRRGENRRGLQDDLTREIIRVRQKRRSGRVYEQIEWLQVQSSELKFSPLQQKAVKRVSNKSNIPKVQFNLELTDKEREDRAKVVLPFEHQGNGEEVHIYDGRSEFKSAEYGLSRSFLSEVHSDGKCKSSGVGEVHYVRDSDDENPDSDEDPDDDLDI